jgi:hypothetical protein
VKEFRAGVPLKRTSKNRQHTHRKNRNKETEGKNKEQKGKTETKEQKEGGRREKKEQKEGGASRGDGKGFRKGRGGRMGAAYNTCDCADGSGEAYGRGCKRRLKDKNKEALETIRQRNSRKKNKTKKREQIRRNVVSLPQMADN